MPYNPNQFRNYYNQSDNSQELYNQVRDTASDIAQKGFGKIIGSVGKGVKKLTKKGIDLAKKGIAFTVKSVIMPVFQALLPYILGVVIIVFLGYALYQIEFEWAGVSEDYNKNGSAGEIVQTKEGYMKPKNINYDDKEVLQFYRHFSNISYYQLKAGSNKIQQAQEGDDYRDYYRQEKNFVLTPGLLTALDRFLLGGKILYPEQYIKPIYHEIKNGKIVPLQLTDENSKVIAQSQNVSWIQVGNKVKRQINTPETIPSVKDYGLASIITYIDDRRVEFIAGTYVDEVWLGDENDKDLSKLVLSEPKEFGPYDYKNAESAYKKKSLLGGYIWEKGNDANIIKGTEDPIDTILAVENIHLLNEAYTFAGVFRYEYKPTVKVVQSSLPAEMRKRKIGTIRYNKRTEYYKETVTDPLTGEKKTVTKSRTVYDYKDIYRYYTGKVYEIIPTHENIYFNDEKVEDWLARINKPDKTKEEEQRLEEEEKERTRYLRDYIFNFEADIPESVVRGTDFEARVGEQVDLDWEAVGVDDATGQSSRLSAGVLQYEDLFAKYSDNEVMKNLLMAIAMQESGGNARDTSGAGWGLMQIEDVKYGKGGPYDRANAFGDTIRITRDPATDERLDPEKSIRWAAGYFKALLNKYEGDPLKALQAYNFGTGAMDKLLRYCEENGLDWMSHTHLIASLMNRSSYGDPEYLKHVLRYYKGSVSELSNMSLNYDTGFFKGLLNIISKWIKNYSPDEMHYLFEGRVKTGSDYDLLLRSARTYDAQTPLSLTNYEYYNFWENEFLNSGLGLLGSLGTAANLNREELIKLVPNIDEYVLPLKITNPRITSPFGQRNNPTDSGREFHHGIDLAVPIGTEVASIAKGKVIVAQTVDNGSYGKYIKIQHDNGVVSLYAHLSEVLVTVGQEVEAGTLIGKTGNSGRSTGPHLHFEVRINGVAVNPYYFAVNE